LAIPFFGEILAVLTALTWAIAVIFFKKSGESVHPIALGLFKNLLGILALAIMIPFIPGEKISQVSAEDFFLLVVSGVLGISLADTLFFKCLNILGASHTAIVDCLYSPFIITLSVIFIGESLSLIQFLGVAMIIFAVIYASRNPSEKSKNSEILKGVVYGALAMAVMAVGVVMIKPIFERAPFFWITQIRMVAGCVFLAIFTLFLPQREQVMRSMLSIHSWKYTFGGSMLGGVISMILWLGGMKYTQASVAAALNQTSTIFILILAAVFLGEKMSRQRIIGAVTAFAGAMLVSYYSS